MRLHHTFMILLSSATLVVGCEKPAMAPTESVDTPTEVVEVDKALVAAEIAEAKHSAVCEECQTAQKFHYSPFFVSVPAGKHYHTITFKDVGLLRDDKSPEAPVLEVIAESISQALQNGDLAYTAEVGFDLKLTDPANHRSCGNNHVYVDVWNRGTDTYGYSLWSGCGEDDNFAWKEVKVKTDGDAELFDKVAPLAESIHDALHSAEETQCFSKHC